MDPITIAALALGAGSIGANVYGAYSQDKASQEQLAYQKKLNREQLAYQKGRDVLNDRTAEQMRRRQELMEALRRGEEQRQRNAALWHPSMAGV